MKWSSSEASEMVQNSQTIKLKSVVYGKKKGSEKYIMQHICWIRELTIHVGDTVCFFYDKYFSDTPTYWLIVPFQLKKGEKMCQKAF